VFDLSFYKIIYDFPWFKIVLNAQKNLSANHLKNTSAETVDNFGDRTLHGELDAPGLVLGPKSNMKHAVIYI
jgi:hypothetical protein